MQSAGSSGAPPPPLPAAVAAELARLEGRVGQSAHPLARSRLAELGEPAAARVLRKIGEHSAPVRTLSGFILFMVKQERLQRDARGIPTAESAACRSAPSWGEETVSGPLHHNVLQVEVLSPNGEVTSRLSNHAGLEIRSPNQRTHFEMQNNEDSAGGFGRVVRNRATMAVYNPPDPISSGLRNEDWIEVDTPVQLMAPPVSTIRPAVPAMANDAMVQAGNPGHCMPSQMEIDIPNQHITFTPPARISTPSPVRDLTRRVQRMALPSGRPLSPMCASPPIPLNDCATSNALRDTASPQMLALERLEFRKIFMIFVYLSGNKIEHVLSVDYIRSLEYLSMVQFESQIWNTFGHKYIMASDRAKNLDLDPTTPKTYHCNVEIRGDSIVNIFKGPYVENTTTHLQKSIGDDNVLAVKFLDKDSNVDFDTYCQYYQKVIDDGIILGLRRYRFFVFKDGGKAEKEKEQRRKEKNKKCTSPVKCYFILTESGWNTREPYILSGRTINQARNLFMHICTAPTLAKYMTRFALILSKTITLDNLSTINVIEIEDEPCRDEWGNIVLNQDGEPLIHTDGTGLISQDLAVECPTNIFKGAFLKSQDGAACGEIMMSSAGSKRRRGRSSAATEHPLLIQFRMFYSGYAVKGTALVDKRLPNRTIMVRPSMIKIRSDPQLCGAQSFNSLEIVSTSNRPRRALTSRFLIALLHYCGVDAEYFMELLRSAIEVADNARCDYEDALKLAFGYADMDNSMPARMILSGIPLEEAYLQSRLAFMARQERKGLKQGRLPIDDSFYLMGTTDPTGTLLPNEVCVILEHGQISGDVLVYKHPGLHFGDIHVLKAKPIENLEKKYVGNFKYAILFPVSGKRSLADEMANSDFDGDMYWISRNPKLLEQFKPCKPWVQSTTQKKTQQRRPPVDESQLERQVFHEYMKTRFKPSFACGTAANCWLAYMDRLLTYEVDESEKKSLTDKVLKLVDIYYSALDAPKTGDKINIDKDLMIKQYPHFMDRKANSSYHSTSILGRIYDEAERLMLIKSENVQPIVMSLLPCFTEREVSQECNNIWQHHYNEYLRYSRQLFNIQDKEEKNTKFEELYQRYKQILFGAAEFEQTTKDVEDVFTEACAIYRIVYEKARVTRDISKCGFVWKVAGCALCQLHALESEGATAICSLLVLRKIFKKDRR